MVEENDQRPQRVNQWGDFWRVAGIAFTVVILMGAGAAGGVALDRRIGTKPLFSIMLLLVGLFAGGWYAYKALMEMLK